jgi:predicted GTPase
VQSVVSSSKKITKGKMLRVIDAPGLNAGKKEDDMTIRMMA